MSFAPHYDSDLDAADRPGGSHGKSAWLAWLVVICLLVYWLRYVLLPFVAAGALAYVCWPVRGWLVRRLKFPRLLASSVVVAAVVAIVSGFGYLAVSRLAVDAEQVARNSPTMIEQLSRWALGGEERVVLGHRLTPQGIREHVVNAAVRLLPAEQAEQWLAAGAGSVMGLFLVCVLLFYFLASGPQLVQGMLRLLPPAKRRAGQTFLHELNPILAHYVRGVLAVFIYTALAAWIGIGLVLRLPHAPLLALLMAGLELIPVAGPISAAVIVGLVAIGQGSLWKVAAAAGFCIVLRLSIDQFIGPLILGRAVTLHPVTIIFAFLAGGALYGLLGVILAVPVAAAIKLALAHAYGEQSG